MYARRIQIHNYGPIGHLDISLPFGGETPRPVVLVGENGSGKSILLSHIVNGLLAAQQIAYPESPEVDTGKAYKLRSNAYIKSSNEFYFGRVDYQNDLFHGEIRSLREKSRYPEMPVNLPKGDAREAWNDMGSDTNDHLISNLITNNRKRIEDTFDQNCILYFPANRFEEPAWLNEENLHSKAKFMDLKHLHGHTDRRIINHASLVDNQKWLFEVTYDSRALELQTRDISIPLTGRDGNDLRIPFQQFRGYSGEATRAYEVALDILRLVVGHQDARFTIGNRVDRAVAIASNAGQLVPNIFQLSSGETGLLSLFLTILRDSDICKASFRKASDIRGIVIVDEIDLHLHSVHQYDVLPSLIKMFPSVQFIITTHSPLFVLGMQREFGEDGFAIHRLPEGQQISPEEFSEFGEAYQAFTETVRHSRGIQTAIQRAHKPIAFVEGTTDVEYIKRAAELLGKKAMLDQVELRDGGGADNMRKAWNGFRPPLTDITPQKVLFLFDCDTNRESTKKGRVYQLAIPMHENNPVERGIENLFARETFEKAIATKSALIDIDYERPKLVRGSLTSVPEEWTVNDAEKMNLCNWLCKNGTVEDFQGFEVVFELLEELLEENI